MFLFISLSQLFVISRGNDVSILKKKQRPKEVNELRQYDRSISLTSARILVMRSFDSGFN